MEIYIQEISALSVLPALTESQRARIAEFSQGALAIIRAYILEQTRTRSECIGARHTG